MPLSKDLQGGGTEVDGGKSALYCSRCYGHGEFRNKDITVGQMQDLVEEKLREMNTGRLMRVLARRQIPRLQRRKNPK